MQILYLSQASITLEQVIHVIAIEVVNMQWHPAEMGGSKQFSQDFGTGIFAFLYSHFARKHHLIIFAFVENFDQMCTNSAKSQKESATPDSIQSTWQEEKNVGG